MSSRSLRRNPGSALSMGHDAAFRSCSPSDRGRASLLRKLSDVFARQKAASARPYSEIFRSPIVSTAVNGSTEEVTISSNCRLDFILFTRHRQCGKIVRKRLQNLTPFFWSFADRILFFRCSDREHPDAAKKLSGAQPPGVGIGGQPLPVGSAMCTNRLRGVCQHHPEGLIDFVRTDPTSMSDDYVAHHHRPRAVDGFVSLIGSARWWPGVSADREAALPPEPRSPRSLVSGHNGTHRSMEYEIFGPILPILTVYDSCIGHS